LPPLLAINKKRKLGVYRKNKRLLEKGANRQDCMKQRWIRLWWKTQE